MSSYEQLDTEELGLDPAAEEELIEFTQKKMRPRNVLLYAALTFFLIAIVLAFMIPIGTTWPQNSNDNPLWGIVGGVGAFGGLATFCFLMAGSFHFGALCDITSYRAFLSDSETIIQFKAEDYDDTTWGQFVEDEWGWEGRSAIQMTGARKVLLAAVTFLSCGVSLGLFGYFSGFDYLTALLAVVVPLGIIWLIVGVAAISRICWRAVDSSKDIRITNGGILRGGFLYPARTTSCRVGFGVVAKRVNYYGGKRLPCIELALSPSPVTTGTGAFIIRVLIPKGREAEAQSALSKLVLCPVPDLPENYWRTLLSGYALDLETGDDSVCKNVQ